MGDAHLRYGVAALWGQCRVAAPESQERRAAVRVASIAGQGLRSQLAQLSVARGHVGAIVAVCRVADSVAWLREP